MARSYIVAICMTARTGNLLPQFDGLNAQQLRRLLVEHLTKQKLGLYWEANTIERDTALNADLVLPRLVREWSHTASDVGRVSPSGRNPTSDVQVDSNVGLRDMAANPTYTVTGECMTREAGKMTRSGEGFAG